MKFNKSKGAVSGTILILAVVLIIIIIVVFVVIKISAGKKPAAVKTATDTTVKNQPPAPVYENQLGDVDFTVLAANDLGTTLAPKSSGYSQPLTTTEKFIQVTVGAQNKGKNDTTYNTWAVGNIVDSDGHNFISINNKAYFYLPQPNLCGAILKPIFEPTPCAMLYEVAKSSTGLKVEVNVTAPKRAETFLDLNVQ